jgi:hypothetical protein
LRTAGAGDGLAGIAAASWRAADGLFPEPLHLAGKCVSGVVGGVQLGGEVLESEDHPKRCGQDGHGGQEEAEVAASSVCATGHVCTPWDAR